MMFGQHSLLCSQSLPIKLWKKSAKHNWQTQLRSNNDSLVGKEMNPKIYLFA